MLKHFCEFEADSFDKKNNVCLNITNVCVCIDHDGVESYIQILVGDEDPTIKEAHVVKNDILSSTFKPYSESKLEEMLNNFTLPELKSITEHLKVKRTNKAVLVSEIIKWSRTIFDLMQNGKLNTTNLSQYFKKGAHIRALSHEEFELKI